MKKVLMIAMALMVASSAAMADHIGVYSDLAGTSCYKTPPAFAPFSMYVVQKFSAGSRAAQFKVVDTTGQTQSGSVNLPAVQLSIGGPYTDLAVTFNGCTAGDIAIVQLNFFGFPVPAAPCGKLEIVAAPTAGGIIKTTTCDFVDVPATGGQAFFGNDTCGGCNEVATEEKTWGQIKALYR